MARCSWTADPAQGRLVYWTDGWDGYAASRQRLLGTVSQNGVCPVWW
jgi:phosphodiesterase/alkaline phosphatase D-like protein